MTGYLFPTVFSVYIHTYIHTYMTCISLVLTTLVLRRWGKSTPSFLEHEGVNFVERKSGGGKIP